MQASYWQREAGWRDEWRDVALPKRADIAVLGGGLSGLATTIQLRERHPGADIVLLEAERVGFGASGRNAGFLSPLAAPVWLLGAARSEDHAWAAAQINREVHAVARWIGDTLEDTELRSALLSLEAPNRLAASGLAEFAEAVDQVGLVHQRVEGEEPARLALAMDAYTMHPYKLVRGLARHAARIGVRVRERSRVRAIERSPVGARVRLEDGELDARSVVVCTNAYTRAIDVGETVRAVALHSFMFASAPLATAIARRGDFTVELNRDQVFHRAHGDRLLYGGVDQLRTPAGGEFAMPRDVQARLLANLATSFPRERGIAPVEGWSGMFHATANGLPIIRRSAKHPAVVLNVGYGGTGVALALSCASLAAAVAAGGDFASADDARLYEVIRETRISVRDSARAIGRILRRLARPAG